MTTVQCILFLGGSTSGCTLIPAAVCGHGLDNQGSNLGRGRIFVFAATWVADFGSLARCLSSLLPQVKKQGS